MSNNIESITRDEQKALIIRDRVGMFKLPKVMGPAYTKVQNFIKEQGGKCENAPFTSYRVDNWDEAVNVSGFKMFLSVFTKKWDIEMGFEVPPEMKGDDTIEEILLPGGQYLKGVHYGPYQKVGDLYKQMVKRSREENYVLDNRSYEYYMNDPHDTPKEKLETRVLVHIVK